jgi:hypothetical protein
VVRNAVRFGDCLLYAVDKNRTLRHPLRGEWTKPIYSTLHSPVKPYTGNPRVSGWGTWSRGFTGTVRVPLVCGSNGLVYRRVGEPLRRIR